MTPKNTNRKGCPDYGVGSNCVNWQGPDLPFLDIYNGQSLSEAVYIIALKVCEITKDLDVSTLDLSCLIDTCVSCQTDLNLVKILQLLLDNDCKLKDLIDNINGNTETTVTLNLNLRCLRKFDDFGNEIAQDLNQTLQSIVNQVCTNTADIASLQTRVNDLQDQIDNIDLNPNPTEVTISTCIAGTRPVSQALVRVADDYCNFKTLVGDAVAIQQAMGMQCEGLNSSLGATEGWIMTPANFAQSFSNLWLAYCNLLARVTLIENNCCKVTCKDIIVGLLITPNEGGDAITVKFSTAMGTFIPDGFEDNGSILTISDIDNKKLEYPIIVSQDGVQGEFSFVGLNLSAPLTASVNAKLQSADLGCEKCVSEQFIPNSNCPVCAVTATGKQGSVTIVYEI